MSKQEHEAKYDAYIEAMGGVKAFRWLMPRPIEVLRKAYTKDEHLNNIPLHLWDKAHPSVFQIYSRYARNINEPGGWSLGDTVCLLKRVAVRLIAEN